MIIVCTGYAAVTQNNGQQKILPGGHVYLLTHRNWKFEKFVSMKIQTNILEKIEAPSADNVLMTVAATINWRISGNHNVCVVLFFIYLSGTYRVTYLSSRCGYCCPHVS